MMQPAADTAAPPLESAAQHANSGPTLVDVTIFQKRFIGLLPNVKDEPRGQGAALRYLHASLCIRQHET